MSTSDIVAIGILVICILLGMFGFFKCLSRFLSGFIVGLLILTCLSVWIGHPIFDKYSQAIFQDGIVFPYLKDHTMKLKEKFHGQLSERKEAKHQIEPSISPKIASSEYMANDNLLRAEK